MLQCYLLEKFKNVYYAFYVTAFMLILPVEDRTTWNSWALRVGFISVTSRLHPESPNDLGFLKRIMGSSRPFVYQPECPFSSITEPFRIKF